MDVKLKSVPSFNIYLSIYLPMLIQSIQVQWVRPCCPWAKSWYTLDKLPLHHNLGALHSIHSATMCGLGGKSTPNGALLSNTAVQAGQTSWRCGAAWCSQTTPLDAPHGVTREKTNTESRTEIFMSTADPSGHFAPAHPPLATLSNNDRKRSANSFPMSLWAKIKKKNPGAGRSRPRHWCDPVMGTTLSCLWRFE